MSEYIEVVDVCARVTVVVEVSDHLLRTGERERKVNDYWITRD